MKVQIDEGAFLPERAHRQDAGLDIKSPVCVEVPARGYAVIDTGVHVQIPYGRLPQEQERIERQASSHKRGRD